MTKYLYFPHQDLVILACILPIGNAEGVARIITKSDTTHLLVLWSVGEFYTIVKTFKHSELDEYKRYFLRLADELGAKNVDLL